MATGHADIPLPQPRLFNLIKVYMLLCYRSLSHFLFPLLHSRTESTLFLQLLPSQMPKPEPMLLQCPKLQTLPEKAKLLILLHLQTNSQVLNPASCPHMFLKLAFPLAQASRHFYHLYRTQIFHLANVGCKNLLLTNECTDLCLAPLLTAIHTLAIQGYGPFAEIFHLSLSITPPFHIACPPFSNQTSSTGVAIPPKLYRADAAVWETQLHNLLVAGRYHPYLRRLHIMECPVIPGKDLWRTIANNWFQCLEEILLDDTYSMFDEADIAHIARMSTLRILTISSQAVRCVDPLANLTQLKELSLNSCLIEDHTFEPVLKNLKHLLRLDVSDTLITPFIMRSLPHTLTALHGGEQALYRREGALPLARCSCFFVVGDGDTHVPACEHSKTLAAVVTRMETKSIYFLRSEQVPKLQELHWGRWGSLAQGMSALVLVLPILRILTLYGPDFDDEVGQLLFLGEKLTHLEIVGCSVTNITAYSIASLSSLVSLSIFRCKGINEEGRTAITHGLAFRRGILQNVTYDSVQVSLSPTTIKEQGRQTFAPTSTTDLQSMQISQL